jgi:ABC-type amino acid transport substrate-binding protein
MIRLLTATLIFLIASFSSAQEKVIRVNDNGSDPNAAYVIKLIKLAIEHIDTQYNVEINKEAFTQAKVNEEVRTNGILDVVWTTADAEIEKTLLPIRIPLLKGLLGYRIFIIHKDNQYKFKQINTMEDLKKITIGQGRTWTDAKILEANGLQVIKSNKYPNLFYMLDGARFDAFARGVNEPFGELAQRPEMKDLMVEETLLISYKMPFYLFVSPDNKQLAKDLELGLNRAIADGSFDKVFYSDPNIKDVLEKANMKNRKVFYLENPFLTKETPLNRTELWFDPKSAP